MRMAPTSSHANGAIRVAESARAAKTESRMNATAILLVQPTNN